AELRGREAAGNLGAGAEELGRADRVGRDLRQQRLSALPAVGGAHAVGSAAGGARSGHAGLLEAQDALDLAQLGIGLLENGGTLDDDVDANPIADGHLVDHPAEVPLELGDARVEQVAAALEVDDLVGIELGLGGEGRGFAHWPKKLLPVKWPFWQPACELEHDCPCVTVAGAVLLLPPSTLLAAPAALALSAALGLDFAALAAALAVFALD